MKVRMILLCLLCSTVAWSQNTETDSETTNLPLIGEWQIDLRPTPDSEPYYQVFAVEQVSDRTLVGTFYGSPLKDGFINKNWPKLNFAFTTQDATHSYYHSGYLSDGKLYGTTYCPGREFIAPWTGVRKK